MKEFDILIWFFLIFLSYEKCSLWLGLVLFYFELLIIVSNFKWPVFQRLRAVILFCSDFYWSHSTVTFSVSRIEIKKKRCVEIPKIWLNIATKSSSCPEPRYKSVFSCTWKLLDFKTGSNKWNFLTTLTAYTALARSVQEVDLFHLFLYSVRFRVKNIGISFEMIVNKWHPVRCDQLIRCHFDIFVIFINDFKLIHKLSSIKTGNKFIISNVHLNYFTCTCTHVFDDKK